MRMILTTALAITVASIGGGGVQAKESPMQQRTNPYSAYQAEAWPRVSDMVYINHAEPKCSVFGSYVGPCAR